MTTVTTLTPRDYQLATADYVVPRLLGGGLGYRLLVAAPTGSGKSVTELLVLGLIPGAWLVTPREEIIVGLLEKLGVSLRPGQDPFPLAFERRVTTPVRFRNALCRGEVAEKIPALILDEGHHAPAETWQETMLLCGMPPAVGFTATPFRGTPRSTAKMLEEWGEPVWSITLAECVARKITAMPSISVVPLVDDDLVELSSTGEFDVTSLESAYNDRLADLVSLVRGYYHSPTWDRPTMVSVPNTGLSKMLTADLQRAGCPAFAVSADTPAATRQTAFRACVDRVACLVQVNVVSEGVDLPIRRIIDAAPRVSPVAWLQMFGRATRPVGEGEPPPEYIVTNRNLLRHGYLLEGLLPSSKYVECVDAFGEGSRGHGSRAVGLECLGRFKPARAKLSDGTNVELYALTDVSNGRATDYACVVHPLVPEPFWAVRRHGVKADGSRDWGRWVACPAPVELRGFASQPPQALTDKQKGFWDRTAAGLGLDPTQPVDKKNFGVMPVMLDTGLRFRGVGR